MQEAYCWKVCKYNSSTFARAQAVRLKNFKLDLMLGSLTKQRIGMRLPSSAQPYRSARRVTTISSVTPCKGLLG